MSRATAPQPVGELDGRQRILSGWLVRGDPDTEPEFAEAPPKFASPTARPLTPGEPPKGRIMLVVEMQRVEYMDIALKLDGFASKQVWEVTPD